MGFERGPGPAERLVATATPATDTVEQCNAAEDPHLRNPWVLFAISISGICVVTVVFKDDGMENEFFGETGGIHAN